MRSSCMRQACSFSPKTYHAISCGNSLCPISCHAIATASTWCSIKPVWSTRDSFACSVSGQSSPRSFQWLLRSITSKYSHTHSSAATGTSPQTGTPSAPHTATVFREALEQLKDLHAAALWNLAHHACPSLDPVLELVAVLHDCTSRE